MILILNGNFGHKDMKCNNLKNFSWIKDGITRQWPFKPTDIEYDQIKHEIPSIECVDYNTAIRTNITNEYHI